MKKRLHLRAVALAITVLLGACGGGGDSPPADGTVGGSGSGGAGGGGVGAANPLEADVIVQLRGGADVDALAAANGLTVVDRFGRRPIWRLRVAPGASADAAITALRTDPGVRFAERNIESQTPEGRNTSVWAVGGDAGVYATQWAPQALQLEQAHAASTGEGVRIAVLDTGIDATHPALAARLARAGDGNILGRDFVDDDNDASEVDSRADAGFGHGTHVAGLVALAAPGARLMPVRVLDAAGRGNTWVLAEALAWAVDPDGDPATDDGAHVINISLGTTRSTELLKTVAELADCSFDDDDEDEDNDEFEDAGFDDDRERCGNRFAAVVASAAGNGGSETEQQFPAAESATGALGVAASTEARRVAGFSNSGSWIQIAAPGEAIVSTVPGGGWGIWSGTSMASPLVAGSAALVLQTLPPGGDAGRPTLRQWSTEQVAKRLTDRSVALCGSPLRQLDAAGAVTDRQTPDAPCP
jgi:subtilisin family serine protease